MTSRARRRLGYTLALTASRVNCELGPGCVQRAFRRGNGLHLHVSTGFLNSTHNGSFCPGQPSLHRADRIYTWSTDWVKRDSLKFSRVNSWVWVGREHKYHGGKMTRSVWWKG